MSARFPPRIFRRVPFEAELRLRYEDDGSELTARTGNVSLGGMFVVTASPRPPGTALELSFKLPEQPAPVRGRGRVAWVREQADGAEPAGMGVRFLELTPGSRELIFEVVERRVRDGGSAYDDGADTASIADRRAAPAPPLPPPAGVAAATARAGEPPPVARPAPRPEAGFGFAAAGAEDEAGEPAATPRAPEPEAPAGDAAGASAGVTGRSSEPAWDAPSPSRASWDAGDDTLPPAPAGDHVLPPVEMPEPSPPRSLPVAGSAYAGRVRRGPRTGWVVAGAVLVVAVAAAAGYLILVGEMPWAGGAPERVVAVDETGAGGGTGAERSEPAAGEGGEPVAGLDPTLDPGADPGAADAGAAGTSALTPGAPAAGEGGVPDGPATGETAAPGAPPADDPAPGRTPRAAREPATRGADPAGEQATGRRAGAAGDPAGSEGADPAPPLPAGADPARRVTRIDVRREAGATVIEIWGDGRFAPGSYRRASLGGERPRELIRLTGIEAPFEGGDVAVDSPEVRRVRTGHHVETDPDELHVVVDLAGPGVAASDLVADGARLSLRLEGR